MFPEAPPMFFKKPMDLPTADTALPGRPTALPTAATHLSLIHI